MRWLRRISLRRVVRRVGGWALLSLAVVLLLFASVVFTRAALQSRLDRAERERDRLREQVSELGEDVDDIDDGLPGTDIDTPTPRPAPVVTPAPQIAPEPVPGPEGPRGRRGPRGRTEGESDDGAPGSRPSPRPSPTPSPTPCALDLGPVAVCP